MVVAAGRVNIDGRKEPLRAGQQLAPVEDRIQPAPRLSYLLKWTREPMCADESPLVPGSNFAGGALVAIDPQGQEMKLTLRKYHIDVHVEDGFARTTIDQTYFNHENQQLEGTFYFPLPADASQKAGIEFLQETGQFADADVLLKAVLADPAQAKRPELWRMGVTLAEKRGMNVRKLECLERALDLEFAKLPDAIDVEALRTDYAALLRHYQNLAESMVALKIQPPAGFLAKVIRTADRWRAVDTDAERASTLAAGTLRRLGDRDLEWDYLTTPIARQPNESAPWASPAATLNRQGELDLSDRAYKAAFEAEPTNAQLLWDRAEDLRQAGKGQQARSLYRQIAEGSWQDRFAGIQSQARARVE